MSARPSFPPLFRGEEAADPLATARAMAAEGCDAGQVFYSFAGGNLAAAVVFAPDVPLSRAAEMIPVSVVGLQNALGALAPPEVAVHVEWTGAVRINGAVAGHLGGHAPETAPDLPPDWLILSLRLDFLPPAGEAGDAPDRTALYGEGCGEITPPALLEAWIRHTLLWTNRWMDGGRTALHREYSGVLHGLRAPADFCAIGGEFIGVDAEFGALLKADGETVAVPQKALVTP